MSTAVTHNHAQSAILDPPPSGRSQRLLELCARRFWSDGWQAATRVMAEDAAQNFWWTRCRLGKLMKISISGISLYYFLIWFWCLLYNNVVVVIWLQLPWLIICYFNDSHTDIDMIPSHFTRHPGPILSTGRFCLCTAAVEHWAPAKSVASPIEHWLILVAIDSSSPFHHNIPQLSCLRCSNCRNIPRDHGYHGNVGT